MATRKRPSKKGTAASQSPEQPSVTAAPARSPRRKKSEPAERNQLRLNMMRSIVTEPLLSKVQKKKRSKFDVIIALNELYEGGIEEALKLVKQRADEWQVKYATVSHYCFACLTGDRILRLAQETRDAINKDGQHGAVIYRIWEDNEISVSLTHSLTTVKADAAQRAFRANGDDIVWAVLDSGIDGNHPHFKTAQTSPSPFGPIDSLSIEKPLEHKDFTPLANGPLTDELGHGTHVAGIIAGYWQSVNDAGEEVVGTEMRNENNSSEPLRQRGKLHIISGIAPRCSLVSLKVIADRDLTGDVKQKAGQGKVSWVLQAIEQIQLWNQHGKRLLIHGVNMSLGYDFDPRWFGCGQSPLCVEVNRLVKSGVSVVVSAGNSGYSSFITAANRVEARYSDLSITDPGNADLAITVGSTHRDMPHVYGVSYFSSRGPTGDGRMKPDLVAPGERIVSCAAGIEAQKYGTVKDGKGADVPVLYCEQTGTSMAAPHVSGAIAAFLSVRREFIGQPERVKEIVVANTIDLRRERKFQGSGLLDLMKTLQAI